MVAGLRDEASAKGAERPPEPTAAGEGEARAVEASEPEPPSSTSPVEPEPAPRPPSAAEPVTGVEPAARDLESVLGMWPAVVDLVRSSNGLLGACIDEARPVAVDGEELTLAYPFAAAFYKKKAEDPDNRATVGEALGALMGGRWRLSYELRDVPAPEARQAAGERSEEELVARFMDEFDAEEIDAEQLGDERSDERGAQAVISNEKGA
jgi:hypothetical protein